MFGSELFSPGNDTLDAAKKAFMHEFLSGGFDDEEDAAEDADYWNDDLDDEDDF